MTGGIICHLLSVDNYSSITVFVQRVQIVLKSVESRTNLLKCYLPGTEAILESWLLKRNGVEILSVGDSD